MPLKDYLSLSQSKTELPQSLHLGVTTDRLPIPDLSTIIRYRKEAQILEGTISLNHTADELWTYVSNTEILFGDLGWHIIRAEPIVDSIKGAVYWVEQKRNQEQGSSEEHFYEFPFEWQAPTFWKVERFFSKGAFLYYRLSIQLFTNETNQTGLKCEIAYLPRDENFSSRIDADEDMTRFLNAIERVDKRIRFSETIGYEAFMNRDETLHPKIDFLARKWKHIEPESGLPERMADYVVTAPERYAKRMRPGVLSYYLNQPKEAVTRFLLNAAAQGFLARYWYVSCPTCKSTVEAADRLSDLQNHFHCKVCQTNFECEFDTHLEVAFRPNSGIRALSDSRHAVSGPSHFPHLMAQYVLDPSEDRDISVGLPEGYYIAQATSARGHVAIDISTGAEEREIEFMISETLSAVGEMHLTSPFKMSVQNPKPIRNLIMLQVLGRPQTATTAMELFTIPEFFELFPNDLPHPAVSFKVHNGIFLTASLKDPLDELERKGDHSVKDMHRELESVLDKHLRENSGRIVSHGRFDFSAVFPEALSAVKMVISMMQAIRLRNLKSPKDKLSVSLALQSGHALAFNKLNAIVFFGQGLAKSELAIQKCNGDDAVISRAIMESRDVIDYIRSERLHITMFDFEFKGTKLPLYRVKLMPFS